jgi:hypothetical protein
MKRLQPALIAAVSRRLVPSKVDVVKFFATAAGVDDTGYVENSGPSGAFC